jgi:poly(3-hydroxybutyrate) depolymerase
MEGCAVNIIRKLDRYRRLVLTGRMRWRVAVGIVHSAAVLFGSPASISAQTAPSGLFVESAPVHLTATYEEWIARAYPTAARELPDPAPDMKKVGAYFTPDLYQSLNGANDVAANRIVYLSDSLKIHGFEVRPRISVPPHPIIIWCRGGIGDGGIRAGDLMIMAQWARGGFIVLATQYRGAAGSEGKDEYGGKDVDDVLTLVQLAHRLPNADHENVFLYGLSRGGMEVYEAIAAGADVRAAVVNSGISDLATVNDRRPDRKEMEALLAAAIPNFAEERSKGFRESFSHSVGLEADSPASYSSWHSRLACASQPGTQSCLENSCGTDWRPETGRRSGSRVFPELPA